MADLTVAQQLKVARLNASLTQSELANLSGIPQQTISRLEINANNIQLNTLVKLCKSMECDVNVILNLK